MSKFGYVGIYDALNSIVWL